MKIEQLGFQLEAALEKATEYKRQLDEDEEDENKRGIVVSKFLRKQKLTSKEKTLIEDINTMAAYSAGHMDGKLS